MAVSASAPANIDTTAQPLGAAAFAAALDRLGPFEASPHIAVAVSGGRDSLALAVLARDWIKARHGRLTALIVDHGLRAESGDEARTVAAQLGRLGIAAEILPWRAAKPSTGLSEAARTARYGLLQEWCARASVLHLLLAHQQDDQAETLLMRLGDGSGMDGLAGMASIRELEHVRLLRPLLGVKRARLTATLDACGLSWVDDPTNGNLHYLRPRLRQAMRPGVTQAAADLAQRFAADRAAIDRRLAALAVDCVSLQPEGWAGIDRAAFARLPDRLAARLLGQVAWTIGGALYRPRQAAILGALAALSAGRNAAGGGCRFVLRGKVIVVAREAGAIGHVVDLDQQSGPQSGSQSGSQSGAQPGTGPDEENSAGTAGSISRRIVPGMAALLLWARQGGLSS